LAQEAVTERIDTIGCDAHSAADLALMLPDSLAFPCTQNYLICGAPSSKRSGAFRHSLLAPMVTGVLIPIASRSCHGRSLPIEARNPGKVLFVRRWQDSRQISLDG
jgi:hypothetical protein